MMGTKPWREIQNNHSKLTTEDIERARARAADAFSEFKRVTRIDQLRKARSLSQAQLAEQLGTNQGALSRLERQTDFYVSTLRRFVHALDGKLKIVVEFEGAEQPIELDLFGDLEPPTSSHAVPVEIREPSHA